MGGGRDVRNPGQENFSTIPVKEKTYIAIDLKSFYASVECVERGLDPLDTCLVVADASRTEKTICLAVSPALKAYGTGGRPRLFEVTEKVRGVNRCRRSGRKSYSRKVLDADPQTAVDFIVAPPRMALYIDYSTRAYRVYLKYIAPEDIHVYSIDEVFMDVTDYLDVYGLTPHELAIRIIRDVLAETGVTATAGIGTNLYLCKVAMDILAKKMKPDKDGVRIAELDEAGYRRQLWNHRPLTDFWRIGHGIAARLARYGITTMGDIARCSLRHEPMLYSMFGINAELIIDHAWGWEPVTMRDIKSYRPATKSISSGQVLSCAYPADKARNVLMEMAQQVALELVEKRIVTDQLTVTVGYDHESLTNPAISATYTGSIHIDHYGRRVPTHAHGTINLDRPTSSTRMLTDKTAELYDRIINPQLLVRRLTLALNRLQPEDSARGRGEEVVQLELFADNDAMLRERRENRERLERERRGQEAILKIKKMFGKNAILTGLNYADGATQRDRNRQIGGHHE